MKDGTCFFNLIGANGIDQICQSLTSYDGRSNSHLYPGMPPFGQTAISNGPVIELVMPRADIDAQGDLYCTRLQQWPLSLSVTADNGLKEIKILDGDTVVSPLFAKRQNIFLQDVDPQGAAEASLGSRHGRKRPRGHEPGHQLQLVDSAGMPVRRPEQPTPRQPPKTAGRKSLLHRLRRRHGHSRQGLLERSPPAGRLLCLRPEARHRATAFDGSPEGHPDLAMNPYLVYDGKTPKCVGWLNHLVADRGRVRCTPCRTASWPHPRL